MSTHDAQDLPFSTLPQNVYVRSHPFDEARKEPTDLYRALQEDIDPTAWANPEISLPLAEKLRARFYEVRPVICQLGPVSPSVEDHELVAMEGTDKPSISDGEDGNIMFTRIVTPRYTKDLAELRMTPAVVDETIIEGGALIAREMDSKFRHSLDRAVIDHGLSDFSHSEPEDAREEILRSVTPEHTLVGHLDTLLELDPSETCRICKQIPFELVARDLLFSIPPEAKFSVRFLKRPTFWIPRTAFMVEFFCYTEVGAKMLHTDGIRRYKLPSRRSPLRLLRLIQS